MVGTENIVKKVTFLICLNFFIFGASFFYPDATVASASCADTAIRVASFRGSFFSWNNG
jgi:hypothetical protein